MGTHADPIPPYLRRLTSVLLTRDQILDKGGPAAEELDVPEWGEGARVRVRGLTGRERDEWEASMMKMRGNKMIPDPANTRSKLLVRCIVDEVGHPVFTHGDIAQLGELAAAPLSRIYDVAARLSGITDSDIEEMVRDFGSPDPSGGPASSPSPNDSTAP